MDDFRYLLAVDPSLTCSGWALFSVAAGEIKAVGKIRGEGARVAVAVRLTNLQQRVEELLSNFSLGEGDAVICEAPTTMRDPHNAIKVEQVRGVFENAARARSVRVPGRINPRTVQYEVMGMKGKQALRDEVKAAAARTVQFLYATNLAKIGFSIEDEELRRHQDIVDAILVGRVGVLRLQAAAQAKVSVESMFQSTVTRSRRSWRVRSCSV